MKKSYDVTFMTSKGLLTALSHLTILIIDSKLRSMQEKREETSI